MRTTEQKQQWFENRKLETIEVLNRLPDSIKPHAYVVGVWVWVEFDEKPDRLTLEALKEIGFSWNNKRKVWQHPCGCFRPGSTDDPRFRYGAIPINALKNVNESELNSQQINLN